MNKFNDSSKKICVFCQYARLLVDMDLSPNIFHEILVTREAKRTYPKTIQLLECYENIYKRSEVT